jgi:hypothetical protein
MASGLKYRVCTLEAGWTSPKGSIRCILNWWDADEVGLPVTICKKRYGSRLEIAKKASLSFPVIASLSL